MKSCVPSLTTDGFVTNKRMIFYKVWEYFLASEFSQSNLFRGQVASVKYVIGTASNITIVKQAEGTLKKLFERYFDNVTVDCYIVDTNAAFQTLSVAITCYDNDAPEITYTLAKDIEHQKGKIQNYNELLSELYQHYTYN